MPGQREPLLNDIAFTQTASTVTFNSQILCPVHTFAPEPVTVEALEPEYVAPKVEPPPDPTPKGAVRPPAYYTYVKGCRCKYCKACRDGLLWKYERELKPLATGREAHHQWHNKPPKEGSPEWDRRRRRGAKTLVSLLDKRQKREWARYGAVRFRYPASHGHYDAPRPGWLLCLSSNPGDAAYVKGAWRRWEFNEQGELVYKRNVWLTHDDLWSYEDELIAFQLAMATDRLKFLGTGCRSSTRGDSYYHDEGYRLAKQIFKRMAYDEAIVGSGDVPGSFGGRMIPNIQSM